MSPATETAASPVDRAAINRRNAQKSTGPRSPEGKNRSKYNAVKHGMTAKTLVLPGEDPEALERRREAWMADLQPQNSVEHYLIEHAVQSSWRLDRAARAETAQLAHNIETIPAAEAARQVDVAEALGYWLFSDDDIITDSYLRREVDNVLVPDQPTSTPDPQCVGILNQPSSIVRRLESTAAGCQWLLDRWNELRAQVEKGEPWRFAEKVKALRLLGQRPLNFDAGKWARYIEGQDYLEDPELDKLVKLQIDAQLDLRLPANRSTTLAILREIADPAIARLEGIAAEHRRRAEVEAARLPDRLSFDDSPDAERLRRYQFACSRALYRSLDTFLKLRKSGVAEAIEEIAATAPDVPFPPDQPHAPPALSPSHPAIPPDDGPDPRNEPIPAPAVEENGQNEASRPAVEATGRGWLAIVPVLTLVIAILVFTGAAAASLFVGQAFQPDVFVGQAFQPDRVHPALPPDPRPSRARIRDAGVFHERGRVAERPALQ